MSDQPPKSKGLILYSIARLADEFGMSRDTVSRRIAHANVQPEGKRNGHAVYRLRDVVPALFGFSGRSEGGGVDPDSLSPEQRRAWFQSENSRLDVMKKARQLIPAAEVEDEMAKMVKLFVQWISTLPDQMERDAGLTPAQVDAMHKSANQARGAIYAAMTESSADESGSPADASQS